MAVQLLILLFFVFSFIEATLLVELPRLGADIAPGYRMLAALGVLGNAEILGVGLKYSLIGPSWLRWHLSDVLFPILIGSIAAILMGRRIKGPYPDVRSCHQAFLHEVRHWRRGLIIGLVLSLVYKAVAVWVIHPRFGTLGLVGGFDPVDLICYVCGAIIGWLVVRRAEMIGNRYYGIELLIEQDQALASSPPDADYKSGTAQDPVAEDPRQHIKDAFRHALERKAPPPGRPRKKRR